MYADGRGVPRDEAEAVRWFRKAAEQGLAPAQSILGEMHAAGQGVTQDEAEAVRWVHLGAEQGHAPAQASLGAMYEQGRGVAQDYAEAQRWYQRAAASFPSGPNRDKAVQASQQMAQKSAPPTPSVPVAGVPWSALVIGNASYPDKPLIGPVNDATDMAALLHRLGFTVTLLHDANKATMERAVEDFTSGVHGALWGYFTSRGTACRSRASITSSQVGSGSGSRAMSNTEQFKQIGYWRGWTTPRWR